MEHNTTDLKKLFAGHSFTWGRVIGIHSIGEYDIVECHPWMVQGCEVKVGRADESVRAYHGYVNGLPMDMSFSSLDEALACAIAFKHDRRDGIAGRYFMRMISRNAGEE